MILGNRVFVSSTCYDLIDLRAHVEHSLRDMGMAPVLSDAATSDFTVVPGENSIETCLVNVASCDHIVVILSQRYGPTLEKYGHPHLSATHLEYQQAVKGQKPIYFYVRDRLLAEYQIWKKNPESRNNYVWCQKADDAENLFKLIKEHEAPPEQGVSRNNWIKTFQSSTDLVVQIQRDLAAPSNKALLQALAEAGQLPEITINKATLQQQHRNPSTLSILFEEVGTVNAYDLVVELKQPNENGKIETLPAQIIKTDHHPPETKGRQYNALFTKCNHKQKQPIHLFGLLEFSYTIPRGWRIGQIFYLDSPPNLFPDELRNPQPVTCPTQNKGKVLLSVDPVLYRGPENPWDIDAKTTDSK